MLDTFILKPPRIILVDCRPILAAMQGCVEKPCVGVQYMNVHLFPLGKCRKWLIPYEGMGKKGLKYKRNECWKLRC